MASFFPLISELLPMIIPASTKIVHAQNLEPASETGPINEQSALTGVCDKMCASVLTIPAKSVTKVRHNSEQDAIIFAQSGLVTLSINEDDKDEIQTHILGPGDFAFIPAWTEHRAENTGDTDAKWVIIQSGAKPVGVELSDWSGDEIATRE